MPLRHALAGAAVLLAAASPASAQFFTDRTTFLGNAAITTTTSIDFDALATGTNLTGSTISGVTFNAPASSPLSVIAGATGVRFAMSPSSGANVLSPGGSNPQLENDDLELVFATPVRAAGLDVVFDVPDGASFTGVTFYNLAGSVLFTNGFIAAPAGAPGYQFVGYISSAADIARIVFDEFDPSPDDDNVAYDSIVFSPGITATAAPEPATLALLAGGLLALGAVRRRRTR